MILVVAAIYSKLWICTLSANHLKAQNILDLLKTLDLHIEC
jgi:hypothetical protein